MSAEQEAYVLALTVELDITGAIQLEMLDDPDRAAAVLAHAMLPRKIRNRAAFATANWKSGFDPRTSPKPVQELLEGEPGPPTLSALEYLWSKPPAVGEMLLPLVAIAVTRAGGFKALQASFYRRERYDENGELVDVIVDT